MPRSRLLPLLSLALLAAPPALPAQTPPQQVGVTRDPATGSLTISTDGVPGRTYFFQSSLDLLQPWGYLPVIEIGAGSPIALTVLPHPPPQRFFLRLVHTDQPHGGDPYAHDFSGGGGGGLPAGWALENGLDPFDPAAASQPVPDSGGLTWLQLYQQSQGLGADPATANAAGLVVFRP